MALTTVQVAENTTVDMEVLLPPSTLFCTAQ